MTRVGAVHAQVTSASELLAAVADMADPAAARRREKDAKAAAGRQQQDTSASPSLHAAANANGERSAVSRLAAARTFYDLLVLSNRGYITLCKGGPPTTHGSAAGAGAGGSKEGGKRRGKGKGEDSRDGEEGKAGGAGAGAGQEQVDGEELYVVARARLTEVVVRGGGEGRKGSNEAGGARTVNVVARAGPAA